MEARIQADSEYIIGRVYPLVEGLIVNALAKHDFASEAELKYHIRISAPIMEWFRRMEDAIRSWYDKDERRCDCVGWFMGRKPKAELRETSTADLVTIHHEVCVSRFHACQDKARPQIEHKLDIPLLYTTESGVPKTIAIDSPVLAAEKARYAAEEAKEGSQPPEVTEQRWIEEWEDANTIHEEGSAIQPGPDKSHETTLQTVRCEAGHSLTSLMSNLPDRRLVPVYLPAARTLLKDIAERSASLSIPPTTVENQTSIFVDSQFDTAGFEIAGQVTVLSGGKVVTGLGRSISCHPSGEEETPGGFDGSEYMKHIYSREEQRSTRD